MYAHQRPRLLIDRSSDGEEAAVNAVPVCLSPNTRLFRSVVRCKRIDSVRLPPRTIPSCIA